MTTPIEMAGIDPWQWLHDNEFSWDDVNAVAAILDAGGFDITRRSTPVPASNVSDEWAALANDIRVVDGNHDLGAGELAARLVARGWHRPAATPGDALRKAAQLVLDNWNRVGAQGDGYRALRAALAHAAPEGLDDEELARIRDRDAEWDGVDGVHNPGHHDATGYHRAMDECVIQAIQDRRYLLSTLAHARDEGGHRDWALRECGALARTGDVYCTLPGGPRRTSRLGARRYRGGGTMSGIEYRVSWKREGRRRKYVRFVSRTAAERRANRVANETDADLHWMCDESHGIYGRGPDSDETCMPPVIEGPVIERRVVGEWERSSEPRDA